MVTRRHLAAVWFADLVGYSRLAAEDERTAQRVLHLLQAAAREEIEATGGHLVKFVGDAVFAEFTSVEAAVRSALALLTECATQGERAGLPLALRIGVHIGDVTTSLDGDLYGDGVNIAARLQAEAEPDQVLVSEDVWRQLRARREYRFTALGERELKGIPARVAVFGVTVDPTEAETARADREADDATPEFAPGSESSGVLAAAAPPARAARNSRSVLAFAVVGLIVLAVLGAWMVSRRGGSAESGRGVMTAIAVLPLRNQGPGSDAYLADGLTEGLTSALTRIRGIAPRPYASVAEEAAKGGDPLALGRRLKVDYVLSGSVRRSQDRVRVTVELIRVAGGFVVWSPPSFNFSNEDVFSVEDIIVGQLVGELAGRFALAADTTGRVRRKPDPQAHDLYLRARRALATPGGVERALTLFEQAVRRDPSFADGWVGLAGAYHALVQLSGRAPTQLVSQWKEAVDRAIALDSLNGEALGARAMIRSTVDWDHEQAKRDFGRAVDLNPGSAKLRLNYSQFLNIVGLHELALAEILRARDLDPTDAFIITNLSWRLAFLGRLDEAAAEARRAITMDTTQWVAHVALAAVAAARNDAAGAVAEAERAHRILGDVPFVLAELAYRYGRAGRGAEAAAVLDKMTALSRQQYVAGVLIARARLGIGDRNDALDALEASARGGDSDLAWQLSLGMFEALRGEPRYEDLLRRTNVAPYMRSAGRDSPTFLW